LLEGYNYLAVIGKEEAADNSVNLRKRDETKEIGKISIPDLLKLFESHRPPISKRREEL
jgi:threonyl-tRNA synthetase